MKPWGKFNNITYLKCRKCKLRIQYLNLNRVIYLNPTCTCNIVELRVYNRNIT